MRNISFFILLGTGVASVVASPEEAQRQMNPLLVDEIRAAQEIREKLLEFVTQRADSLGRFTEIDWQKLTASNRVGAEFRRELQVAIINEIQRFIEQRIMPLFTLTKMADDLGWYQARIDFLVPKLSSQEMKERAKVIQPLYEVRRAYNAVADIFNNNQAAYHDAVTKLTQFFKPLFQLEEQDLPRALEYQTLKDILVSLRKELALDAMLEREAMRTLVEAPMDYPIPDIGFTGQGLLLLADLMEQVGHLSFGHYVSHSVASILRSLHDLLRRIQQHTILSERVLRLQQALHAIAEMLPIAAPRASTQTPVGQITSVEIEKLQTKDSLRIMPGPVVPPVEDPETIAK